MGPLFSRAEPEDSEEGDHTRDAFREAGDAWKSLTEAEKAAFKQEKRDEAAAAEAAAAPAAVPAARQPVEGSSPKQPAEGSSAKQPASQEPVAAVQAGSAPAETQAGAEGEVRKKKKKRKVHQVQSWAEWLALAGQNIAVQLYQDSQDTVTISWLSPT